MNTKIRLNRDDLRLSLMSRLIRLAIGTLLFAVPYIQNDPPAIMAVLPLLAIYPILTGILGFGLVEVLAISNQCRSESPPRQVKVVCICLFTFGTGLIAFVMGNDMLPAWLALAAMFLLLVAILGLDKIGNLLFNKRTLQAKNETTKAIESE
jgi:hypothetical protein